jgi:hypothetical protein
MRNVTRTCDRCGAVLTNQPGSILEVKAGELTKHFAEPWLDLCTPCSERFADWLRSGLQVNHGGPRGAQTDAAVMLDPG